MTIVLFKYLVTSLMFRSSYHSITPAAMNAYKILLLQLQTKLTWSQTVVYIKHNKLYELQKLIRQCRFICTFLQTSDTSVSHCACLPHNYCWYSCLPTEGWPGWVDLVAVMIYLIKELACPLYSALHSRMGNKKIKSVKKNPLQISQLLPCVHLVDWTEI